MSALSDNAIQSFDADQLDRKRLAAALRDVIAGPGLMTPITIGVYGGWGAGKTSVMRMVRSALIDTPSPPLTMWFDAWKYARAEESLWRALLLEVVAALGDETHGLPRHLPAGSEANERKALEADLERLRTSLYRSQSWVERGDAQINWRAAFPFAADLALRFIGLSGELGLKEVAGKLTGEDASKAFDLIERQQIERHQEHVRSLEQFQQTLQGLVRREIVDRTLRLVVFVDDLDRCLPEDAVAALEAVKLFLDLEGCVFVLGMDRDVVERGILVRYPPVAEPDGKSRLRVDPRQYLDKIIQLPISLPPLTPDQIGRYLGDMLRQLPQIAECRDLIEASAPSNPRTLKRVLNVLSLIIPLGNPDNKEVTRRLAKLVVLQTLFEEVYRAVVLRPELLIALEAKADGRRSDDETAGIEVSGKLKELFTAPPRFSGLDNKTLAAHLALAEVTGGSST